MTLALDGVVNYSGASGMSMLPGLTTANTNVVIILFIYGNGTSASAISDTAGLTWNFRASYTSNTYANNNIALYYAVSSAALSNDVITITSAAFNGITAIAFGVSGANTTTPFDTNVSLPMTGETDPGTISTTASNTMALGAFIDAFTAYPTPGAGYSQTISTYTFLAEYQVFSSPQTNLSVTQGSGTGISNGYICDALQAAGGGAAAQVSETGKWFDAVYQAWVPSDPLPTLTKKVTASYIAPSQPNISYSRQGIPVAVWDIPPDPLPTLTRQLTFPFVEPAQSGVSYSRQGIPVAVWGIPPDPLPTLTAKLVQGAGPTSVTYLGRPWLSTVLQAWVPPDPLPTLTAKLAQGATQPFVPSNVAVESALAALSWTPPDPLPTLTAKLVQGAGPTSVTYLSRPWLSTVLQAWVPPDPLPTLTAKLAQGATQPFVPSNVAVESALAALSWTPPDPLPTLTAKLVQGAGPTSATYLGRPWLSTVLQAWIPPDPLPTLTAKLPQSFVPAAPPAFSYSVQGIPVAVWGIPPDPLPTLTAKLAQGAGPTSATYLNRPWLDTVNASWTPPDPLPTLTAKLAQGAGPTSATYLGRPWLSTVLQAWVPPDPLPTLTAKLVQGAAPLSIPFSSAAQISIAVASWVAPDPLPTLTAKLVQGAGPTSATYLSRPWLDTVNASWTPPDPLPTLTAKLAQGAAPSFVPSVTYSAGILSALAAWLSPDPLPTLTNKFAQGAGSTSATYVSRSLASTYIDWIPPDPLPTLTNKFPQGAGATATNYASRSLASTYITWIPPDPLPTLTVKLPQGTPLPSPFTPSGNAAQSVIVNYALWLLSDLLPTLSFKGGFHGTQSVSSAMRLNLVDESSIASANLAGLQVLSENQTTEFELYIRYVLPMDGYVFWLGTGRRVGVRGSIHVAADKRQNEDETLAVNRVVLTTGEAVQQFNVIGTNQLWIGHIAGVKFAFSRSGPRYKVAGLYHYNGEAVYPALGNMLVPVGSELPLSTLIVSDSMPLWLDLINYTPIWLNPPNPNITLYPSFLLPDNLTPPYGAVHISSTRMLQATPLLGPTTPMGDAALGSVTGTALNTTHQQLVADRVRVTLYGLTNQQALDWIDLVNRYSYDQDLMGIMSASPMRDDKRTQAELGIIAMKKTIEFEVSYYQSRANSVAQSLIVTAPLRAVTIDPFISPV